MYTKFFNQCIDVLQEQEDCKFSTSKIISMLSPIMGAIKEQDIVIKDIVKCIEVYNTYEITYHKDDTDGYTDGMLELYFNDNNIFDIILYHTYKDIPSFSINKIYFLGEYIQYDYKLNKDKITDYFCTEFKLRNDETDKQIEILEKYIHEANEKLEKLKNLKEKGANINYTNCSNNEYVGVMDDVEFWI